MINGFLKMTFTIEYRKASLLRGNLTSPFKVPKSGPASGDRQEGPRDVRRDNLVSSHLMLVWTSCFTGHFISHYLTPIYIYLSC